VRDEDRRQPAREFEEAVEERGLGAHVEVRRRLVEDEDARAALDGHQRAGDRDALPLPARELRAVGVLARERRLEPVRQPVDELERACAIERGTDPRFVAHDLDRAETDVVADGEVVVDEVLEDRREAAAPAADRVLGKVAPVDGDPPALRLVEPREELDERRLAGAVQPDDRERASGLDRQVELAQHGGATVAVGEAHALEADLPARRAGGIRGRPRPATPRSRRGAPAVRGP